MTPQLYIDVAKKIKASGRYHTDGCSFIGWLMDDKYEPACWAHDFARKGLYDEYLEEGQADNDNMFRSALRHLGMAPWKSNMIYWFTRAQGFMSEKVGMGGAAFAGFLGFIAFIVYSFIKSGGLS